jgi:Ca2+-transporting ATPase
MDAELVAQRLRTHLASGLSAAEAQRRLETEGPNELRGQGSASALSVLLRQFRSVVIWILIGAAVLSAVLHERLDAIAIGLIVVLNALIGFYQEWRAERSMAALRALSSPQAHVVRDGAVLAIPAPEIVRGDLLLLEAGDRVAADARLIAADALRADEAPLTGESEPVGKLATRLASAEIPLAERVNMAYQGTGIVAGQGRALVVATGMDTEVGQIASLIQQAGAEDTPLQRRLDQVGRHLLLASLAIVAVVFCLGVFRGEPPFHMLLVAVSLAVAAVPEGLPAVVTVALSLGVGRMVGRNALVRRLSAVETLGSVQVICSDKTGTLTTGEMTVRALWTAGREIQVTGSGYAPEGSLCENGERIDGHSDPPVRLLLTAAAASSEAILRQEGETPTVLGDPTEGALLVAAAKVDIRRDDLEQSYERLRVLPFDSERKRMTIVRATPAGPRAFVKGAPDVLLELCHSWAGADGESRPLTPADRAAVVAANEAFAQRAMRVIAVAVRELSRAQVTDLAPERLEQELTLIGLLAMYDPPRPEAREAVDRCRRAGIRTVMITGDHPATATAVGQELGMLAPGDAVLSGAELQRLTAEQLSARVDEIAVYARVTAADKLRIVHAFRARGTIVAMTGDGVNDAPAVKEASVGLAMGRTGTEVTKEASDVVITDDNFASIVAAVEEGRGIYDNIKKCLQYLLAGNAAEILVMLVASLVAWPVPLVPIQLLWINLVTDGLPALALASDPVDPSAMSRPPRPSEEQLVDRAFLLRLLVTGALSAIVALAAFGYAWLMARDLSLARTYAFTALVFEELLRSLTARSRHHPSWTRAGFPNPRLLVVVVASIVLQTGILLMPSLHAWFGVHPISLLEICALLALGAIPSVMLDLWKVMGGRTRDRDRPVPLETATIN